MKYRVSMAFVVLTTFLMSTRVRADTNAADLYRQAFAQPLSTEAKVALAEPIPSAENVDALMRETQAASDMLHQAAQCQQCDWKIDLSGQTNMSLAFLGGARDLSAAQAVRAAKEFKDGKIADAVQTWDDLLVCGRRIQGIPLIVARLAGKAVEARSFDQIAENLPNLDSASIQRISDTVSKLPAPSTLDDAIAAEKRTSGKDVTEQGVALAKDLELWFDAHQKMFEAALAAPHGTEKDFAATQDPADGKPFDFTSRPQGYQLISRVVHRGKAATLIVGPHDSKQ